MKIVPVKDVQSKPNPHGVDARSISDTTNAQVAHITLQPGEALKKHITPVDVVFYVLEGRGVVGMGEERAEVVADTLVESPAKIAHRWINESQGPLRILVVKTPPAQRSHQDAVRGMIAMSTDENKALVRASLHWALPGVTWRQRTSCWPKTSPCTCRFPARRAFRG